MVEYGKVSVGNKPPTHPHARRSDESNCAPHEVLRCAEVCRHIVVDHDAHDPEALYTLAQASEALGMNKATQEWMRRIAEVNA